MRRRSFDSGEIKRAADGGASIDCCCNYNAILAQSQMKLFRTKPAVDANVLLQLSVADGIRTEILDFGDILIQYENLVVCCRVRVRTMTYNRKKLSFNDMLSAID